MVTNLVDSYEAVKKEEVSKTVLTRIGSCPHCGGDVIERHKGWFCSNNDCQFVLWKDNAFFKSIGKHLTVSMVEKLLQDKQILLKGCKSEKNGNEFDAVLHMRTERDGRARFHMEFTKNKE